MYLETPWFRMWTNRHWIELEVVPSGSRLYKHCLTIELCWPPKFSKE